MTSAPASTAPPAGLLSKLGIPPLTGHTKFVFATGIDSLGTGLVTVFILIYFVKTTTLTLPAIGGAMTMARLLAVPTALVVGPLLDRWGARTVAAAGNIVCALGFTGFLFVESVGQLVAVVLLVQIGQTTYWTCSSALIVLASPKQDRTRWFGFVHALRNAAMGLGGALGSAWLVVGSAAGLDGIVLGNAASCLLAALLLMSWRPEAAAGRRDTAAADSPPPGIPTEPNPRAGYAAVLRDTRYLLLVAINLTFVFGALLINVLLAIYIVEGLNRGPWIAGALLVLAAVQVSLTQTAVSKRLDRYRTTRVLLVACLLNAVAFGLFALMDIAPAWTVVPGLFLAMFVLTIGETVWSPPIDSLSVSLAAEHTQGRYLAIYQLSWTFGQITAPALFTFLLARGAVLPLLFLLAVTAVAVPMVLLLERMITARTSSAAPLIDDRQLAAA
ncbi:MFS transporter [Catellatospora sichuanensis]|uniref:MFS transporter n=1 Tax=Catellatospora sichuanensis TaxID=1969805 RepID=UPI0016436437|nr:MFS transporter [Catellatospora sichuanensis]